MENENCKTNDIKDKLIESIRDDMKSIKDGFESYKKIQELKRKIIEILKLIKLEREELKTGGLTWNEIDYNNQQKLMVLYDLEQRYRAQYDIILHILGKEDFVISNSHKQFMKDKYSIDDKFFIDMEEI